MTPGRARTSGRTTTAVRSRRYIVACRRNWPQSICSTSPAPMLTRMSDSPSGDPSRAPPPPSGARDPRRTAPHASTAGQRATDRAPATAKPSDAKPRPKARACAPSSEPARSGRVRCPRKASDDGPAGRAERLQPADPAARQRRARRVGRRVGGRADQGRRQHERARAQRLPLAPTELKPAARGRGPQLAICEIREFPWLS